MVVKSGYLHFSRCDPLNRSVNTSLCYAVHQIRPPLLKDLNVNRPIVAWESIGGYDVQKGKLQRFIEWPITHAQAFSRFGIEAPPDC